MWLHDYMVETVVKNKMPFDLLSAVVLAYLIKKLSFDVRILFLFIRRVKYCTQLSGLSPVIVSATMIPTTLY